jgi:6-phosphogluconolactonase (cycloisomerase 2 family)
MAQVHKAAFGGYVAWTVVAFGIGMPIAAPADDRLAFMEVQQDDANGVDGLSGCVSVSASADGRFVYASSAGDAAISYFSRDSSGRLTYLGMAKEGVDDVTGMGGPFFHVLSPDEKHLYVASRSNGSVTALARDTTTGALSFVGSLIEGEGGVVGMTGAIAPGISPDGAHVYVASVNDDAVAIFSRDPTTGALTFVDAVFEGDSSPNGPVGGLLFPEGVLVSNDNAHVYVVGTGSGAVAMFARNAATGALSYLGAMTVGISSPLGGAISADGAHLYIGNRGTNSLAILARDAQTGLLTRIGAQYDGISGVDGLAEPAGVAISAGGKLVAVVSRGDQAVSIFRRDPATGLLTFVEARYQGVGGIAGLSFPSGVGFGGDSSVYTAGWTEGMVAVFAVTLFGDGFETGTTSGWSNAIGVSP